MPISLHSAVVPQWLQLIKGLTSILEKTQDYCESSCIPETEMVEARLAPDMAAFASQVKWARVHSMLAVEGLRAGTFSPDLTPPPATFADMQAMMRDTQTELLALAPDEFEGFIGKPMEFRFKDLVIPYTGDTFLFQFSLPNFYFHVTTAYDIARNKGVPIGKLDYIGMRA